MDLPRSLAHYDVTSAIGKGGMGEVVRARDTRLGREVALKLLPVEFADDAERLARFEREARTLAQLQHPNIASVYGLEQDAGRTFLVMELVEGEDLSQRLARGAVPVDEAVAIAAGIAAGLEEAHERGIVHRDLKPGNVMLAPDGQVKILDFGLARAFQGDGPAESDISDSPTITALMTGVGVILGTAGYMSPEQARGRQVDRRADIWALGVILCEMLTGERLFAGETVSDTLAAVLRKDVDLEVLPERTPPAVRRLIVRCLDRDPRRRLRDAGEARIALEDPAALEEGTIAAAPATGRGRAAVWAAGVVVAACLAAVGAWLLKPVPEAPLRKLTLDPGPERLFTPRDGGVAISPDGRRVAYAAEGRLWIHSLDQGVAMEVAGSEDADMIFWSPDAAWVGYASGRSVWKVPAGGGQPLRVTDLDDVTGPAAGAAWLDDDTIVMTTGNTGLSAFPAAGGKAQVLVPMDPEVEQDTHQVSVLPDGGLVYVLHNFEGVHTIEAWRDGERHKILTLPGEYLKSPVYAPSGHLFYVQGRSENKLWAVAFDQQRLEVTGEPFFVAPDADVPSVSADGTLIYRTGGASAGDQQVAMVDAQGADLKIFGHAGRVWPYPALGAGAEFVVAVVRGVGAWDLWVYDDRGAAVRLTDDVLDEDCPILTPDGRHTIYGTGNANGWSLNRRAVDGTGVEEVLVGSDSPLAPHYFGTNPWMSADGRLLLYGAKGAGGGQDVALLHLDEDGLPAGPPEAVVATGDAELGGALDPSGRFLAYCSDVTGPFEVYVARFPSGAGRRQVSVSGGAWPRWRGDGRELYYVAKDSLTVVDIELGDRLLIDAPRRLFPIPHTDHGLFGGLPEGYDMSPDARQFLISRWSDREGLAAVRSRIVVVENWLREFR